MPLDIGEIGVRVNVREPGDHATGATAGADAGAASSAPLSAAQQSDIVNQCVRLVLQALRNQGAR